MSQLQTTQNEFHFGLTDRYEGLTALVRKQVNSKTQNTAHGHSIYFLHTYCSLVRLLMF